MQTTHPTRIALLTRMYQAFSKGDAASFVAECADNVTFQIPGKSAVAGKFTKQTIVSDMMTKLRDLSDRTFAFEVHDILVSDLHATVLASTKMMSKGKPIELRTVHVWRFDAENRPLAGYEYPRDLYAFDAAWA